MTKLIEIFDKKMTRQMICKGRRGKWLERKGSKASGFRYVDCNGKQNTDPAILDRVKALVIPPAWTDVRICPSPSGRLQVVGMDTRGRIQYRYHPSFSKKQERKKFAKVEKFGEFLPKLRKATNEHLSAEGLPKEKVLAAMLRLINSLYFRVGTDLSEKHYKTYGITTLKKNHLTVRPNGKLIFDFVGKSHVQHRKILVDEDLAAVVKDIAALPGGRRLFRFIGPDGKKRTIKPSDVNSYLKSITDPQFSSKDFRTWGATLLAAIELAEIGIAEDEALMKKNLVNAVKRVAEELGNTPAVCRSSYIHPAVIESYLSGTTIQHFTPKRSRRVRRIEKELEPEESALLQLLKSAA
ncbi:MAG: DNA topoisomerase IB [bacterium]|nr:DNA topoisomerase IB [bacterium]